MDFSETEEQKMIRRMAREFAQNEVRDACWKADKNTDPEKCYPRELTKRASKLGLRTLSIPAEYGGGGVADAISQLIVCEELAAEDIGFSIGVVGQTYGLTSLIDVVGSKEQKDEWFPRIVGDDTFLLGWALCEPNAGTDNFLMTGVPGCGIQTFAERKGDEYVINGTKHFVSNGHAKLWIVNVRTDRKLPLSQCRSQFLVSPDTPGFKVNKFHDKLGARTLTGVELVFEDMRVPARNLLGKEGAATKHIALSPMQGFCAMASRVGHLKGLYEKTVEYASNRVQGGKPIVRHQLIAAHLSEMRARIEAARYLLYREAWCCQNKYEYDPKLTLVLRAFVDQCAAHIAYQVLDIHGGVGIDKEMIIEKSIRDVFSTIHSPSIGQSLIRGAPGWVPETRAA